MVKRDEKLLQKGNCIAFIKDGEGSMGYGVYKAEDFIATTNIALGYAPFLNPYTGIFITTIADKVRGKYSYNYKRSEERLKREMLQLPVDDKGNPDWPFMEEYIRERERFLLERYSCSAEGECEKVSLDGVKWGEFVIGDLFDVSLPSGDVQADKCETGDFPLLSAGFNNNGICKFITCYDEKANLYNGNVISVDMFGKAFFHGYNFYSVSHGRINILVPRTSLNKYHLQFVITAISYSVKGKFSYNQMCSSKRVKKLLIQLPIDEFGRPDYSFMEKFMRSIERRLLRSYIGHLQAKLRNTPPRKC